MTVSAAEKLRDEVDAMHRPQDTLNFTTDHHNHPRVVLMAIWLPAGSFVMAIDKTEWDGMATAKLLGFDLTPKGQGRG